MTTCRWKLIRGCFNNHLNALIAVAASRFRGTQCCSVSAKPHKAASESCLCYCLWYSEQQGLSGSEGSTRDILFYFFILSDAS